MRQLQILKRSACQWLTLCFFAASITACGGGGGGGSNSTADANSGGGSSSVTPTASQTSTSSPTASSPTTVGGGKNVHITWSAPATRTDGTALPASEIQGYRLFYAREDSSTSEDSVAVIDGGSTTSTDVPLASSGTYTFAITAVDTNGTESALSTPVSITVN